MEHSSASRAERPMTPLEQAHETLDWLPNYMYGWTDTTEELPSLAKERLIALFGSDEVKDHLSRLKTVFMKIPAEHQANVGLFISGYPDDVVAELSEVSIDQTVAVLHQLMDLQIPEGSRRIDRAGRRLSVPLRIVRPLPDLEEESRRQARQHEFMTSREGLEWQDDALCAQTDPEAFFPEKGGSTREAKKVCASCRVRDNCLDHALANDERFGVWGGLSERERRHLSARKKRAVTTTEQNETSDTTS